MTFVTAFLDANVIAIRDSGVEEAEELATKAWKANSHVAAVLAGTKEQKPSTN